MRAAPLHRRKGAFSLVELIVAMAVLTMLLLFLLSIVDHTTKLWQASENRVDGFREARAALNIIATDLHAAHISKDEQRFRLNVRTDLPGTAVSETGSIFFLCAQPGDAQDKTPASGSTEPGDKSDVCAVGYFVGFDAVALRGARSMNLYRYFLGSTDTIERIRAADPLFSGITTGPSGAEVLARNITGFKVRGYSIDKKTGRPAEIPVSDPATPDYVEIELTAVNTDTAGKIPENSAAWRSEDSAILKQNARTFALRVDMPPAQPDSIQQPPATP